MKLSNTDAKLHSLLYAVKKEKEENPSNALTENTLLFTKKRSGTSELYNLTASVLYSIRNSLRAVALC